MRELDPGEGQDLQFILTEEGDRWSLSWEGGDHLNGEDMGLHGTAPQLEMRVDIRLQLFLGNQGMSQNPKSFDQEQIKPHPHSDL